MLSICERCGDTMNRGMRGGNISRLQSAEHLREHGFIYRCPRCHFQAFNPPQCYEDRIEWFFDRVMPKVLAGIGIAFLIGFVLQVLGIYV